MPYIVTRNTVNVPDSHIEENTNKYPMNDLGSVFTHWDPTLGKNVPTENKLKGDGDNGKDSRSI